MLHNYVDWSDFYKLPLSIYLSIGLSPTTSILKIFKKWIWSLGALRGTKMYQISVFTIYFRDLDHLDWFEAKQLFWKIQCQKVFLTFFPISKKRSSKNDLVWCLLWRNWKSEISKTIYFRKLNDSKHFRKKNFLDHSKISKTEPRLRKK